VNTLEQLLKHFDIYLYEHGEITIDIEKDAIFFQGRPIHTVESEENSLPFALFRDGVRWLKFIDGITKDELQEFMDILIKYSVLSDEPEGDIAIALWERKFTYIEYETVDMPFDTEYKIDLEQTQTDEDTISALHRESKLSEEEKLQDPAIDQASIEISAQEQAQIKEMILIEKRMEPTAYLDALFDSLIVQVEKDNFEVILDMLKEELQGSLNRKDLDGALKILNNLNYIMEERVDNVSWAVSLIDNFYLYISRPECLDVLTNVWSQTDISNHTAKMQKFLTYLKPEAIHTLGEILHKTPSLQMRRLLTDVIATLAARDFSPLQSLLTNPDEELIYRLIPVLTGLEDQRCANILSKFIRHKSLRIRQEAIKAQFHKGALRVKDLFRLIDDKDASIRALVFKQIGLSRDNITEKFLVEYLERPNLSKTDSSHITECFKALGKCGSSFCIPFLRRTLFSKGWLPGSAHSPFRNGAAIALNKLDTNESTELLKKARRSLYPGVRGIIKRANKDNVGS